MDINQALDKMLYRKRNKPTKPILKKLQPLQKGKFQQSYHHMKKPNRIDDETWWYPATSGPITKGYWKGYNYDAKRKVVLDGNKIIHKI